MGCLNSKPEASKANSFATGGIEIKGYVSSLFHQQNDTKTEEITVKAHEELIIEDVKAKKGRESLHGRLLDLDEKFIPPRYPKSVKEALFLDTTFRSLFLFADLTGYERTLLIDAMQKETPKEGDLIIKQGDVESDFFYICQQGVMSFVVDGNAVGSCGPGGTFGELALLYDSPRAATCVASSTDLVLWKVDQGTFRHLLARSNQEKEGSIMDTLSRIDLFNDLDRQTVTKFADAMNLVKYKPGEKIIIKGEMGNAFYIVKSGQVRLHDFGLGNCYSDFKIRGEGYWFGERSLFNVDPPARSITAINEVEVYAIGRDNFTTSFGSLELILKDASRKRFIRCLPIFKRSLLTDSELNSLVMKSKQVKYFKGHVFAEAGEEISGGDNPSLYIVRSGKIMDTAKDGKILLLGPCDYFGEKAVVHHGSKYLSLTTCIAEENTVCWVLTKSDIKSIIGDMERLGKPIAFTPKTLDSTLCIEHIKKHKLLGMGAFGKVWLATSHSTTNQYALKTMIKRQLIDTKSVDGIMREKQIMASTEHPLILPLNGSFQDDNFLYLLLPFKRGGELFNVINAAKRDSGLPVELLNVDKTYKSGALAVHASQFYGGCILSALQHLHARNIAYRDLKPENAMIDKEGYCIMIDFGFAKIVVDKTYTLCGTPEYLAPEIIMSKGHDTAADYWSFGVLLYEMLAGVSPFFLEHTDQISLFRRIVTVKYKCPSYMSDDAKDIIKKLLTRRQSKRLGNLSSGSLDVMEHPWFSSLDFQQLNKKKVMAPWKPNITNPLDSSNFDDYSHAEQDEHRGQPLSYKEQQLFTGF